MAQLQAIFEDLQNRRRRKNLEIVCLHEKVEGSILLAQFLREIIPKWLRLPSDLNFETQRAHRLLAPTPGVNDPPQRTHPTGSNEKTADCSRGSCASIKISQWK